MKIVLVSLLSLVAINTYAKSELKEFDLAKIKEIDIENTEGNVTIVTTTTGKASIEANKKTFSELDIEIEPKRGKRAKCEVDLKVTVAEGTKLDIDLASGDLVVDGNVSEVDFAVGSGSVKITGKIGEVEGKTGSGDISISGLSGPAEVKSGSGDIQLTYGEVPAKGEVEVRTGSGDATVALPASAKVRTKLTTGSGKITNELGDQADARFKVSITSGSGDLSLKKL
jgi:DUF4097 and DUF4098 domain-containing protein YvlB